MDTDDDEDPKDPVSATPRPDAGSPSVRDASQPTPPGDTSKADAATPTLPTEPTCVAGPETCDGKDNDCNGQVDDNAQGAATWFRDCDGDGFAASTSGSVVSCKKPAAVGTCKAWVDVSPSGVTTTDCDDTSERYKPGAEFGLPSGTNASNDLNCDGRSEPRATLTTTTGTQLSLCEFPAACNCYRAEFRNGQPLQDWSDWSQKQTLDPHPAVPCSTGASDVIQTWHMTDGPNKLFPQNPGCAAEYVNSAILTVDANQHCR